MRYEPTKHFEDESRQTRIIGDLDTSDWWWNLHRSLPEGHFVIPLIFASDATFLTNFCGDKDIDPINFTVANIHPKIRNCPNRQAWRCLGIFPEPGEIMQQVLQDMLFELPDLWNDGIKLTCPDGKIRFGHLILAAWIADYVEYNKLFTQVYGSCTICTTPTD
ncbi:hypothetical protein BJ508DRAFT_219119, partial [Ascobolus immersus RN42]